jgi:hypothetical protein
MKKLSAKCALVVTSLVLLVAAPASASKESKAAKLLNHYYNVYMVAQYNQGVHKQNSSIPSVSTAGIHIEISAINRFDNEMQTIKFPKSDVAAENKVLDTTAILVALDHDLALNTDDVSEYNSLLNGVVTAAANETAAFNALFRKLGIST